MTEILAYIMMVVFCAPFVIYGAWMIYSIVSYEWQKRKES